MCVCVFGELLFRKPLPPSQKDGNAIPTGTNIGKWLPHPCLVVLGDQSWRLLQHSPVGTPRSPLSGQPVGHQNDSVLSQLAGFARAIVTLPRLAFALPCLA